MSNIEILLKVVSARTISLSCTSKEYNKEIVEDGDGGGVVASYVETALGLGSDFLTS